MIGVAEVAARLARAGCIAPEAEASELLADGPADDVLERRLARREAGEPLAWITGWTSFCGHRVRVDPGVYVPRPQTEVLARRAADRLGPSGAAVDLCTGSGAIVVHLRAQAPGASCLGVDVDARAVRCARANGVNAVMGDLGAPLRPSAVEVVTCVPPYVPTDALGLLPADVRRHEPVRALDGGADGLDVARRVVRDAARILRPGGWLLLEAGGAQDGPLADALVANGFVEVTPWTDEEGDVRGLEARRL